MLSVSCMCHCHDLTGIACLLFLPLKMSIGVPRQSFTMHLMRLMTSWAVVCYVWYLEPQTLRPGETPIEFSERYVC